MKHNLPIKIELPEHFLDEEVRCDYKITSNLKKLWAVELDLLTELDRVCQKYNLRWFADGGTALGAVRHHGFIPWDDDIDIMMLRADFDKLCAVANDNFSHPYLLQTYKTEKSFLRGPRALFRNTLTTAILEVDRPLKLPFNQGIFIDIFPIDEMPENTQDQEKLIENICVLEQKRWNVCREACGIRLCKNPIRLAKRVLRYVFLSTIGRDRLMFRYNRMHDELLRAYSGTSSNTVADLTAFPMSVHKNMWPSFWFDKTIMLPFEFIEIPLVGEFDDFLVHLYGDWHKMIKGTALHSGVFYDVEKPYANYLK